jgi:four helix bundle protein
MKKQELAKKVRDLNVYQAAFKAAMEIFKLSKKFPKEEKYSMTDQIRRASRSVCSNLSEGWHKRRYIAAFIHKLTDAVQEASETQTWLEFSFACGYLTQSEFEVNYEYYEHIIAQLITMERKAESFCKTPSSAN